MEIIVLATFCGLLLNGAEGASNENCRKGNKRRMRKMRRDFGMRVDKTRSWDWPTTNQHDKNGCVSDAT